MCRFEASDFGYDSAAAVGFGKGSFGCGWFGLDADTIEWLSPPLKAGVYRFSVMVVDGTGNKSSFIEKEPITVTPASKPAVKLDVSTFERQTNQLVLKILDTA
jgi:hypothetical protein